jgi:hypothetical protein
MDSIVARVVVRGVRPGSRKLYLDWRGSDGGIYHTSGQEAVDLPADEIIKGMVQTAVEFDPVEMGRARQLAMNAALKAAGEYTHKESKP